MLVFCASVACTSSHETVSVTARDEQQTVFGSSRSDEHLFQKLRLASAYHRLPRPQFATYVR